MSEVDHNLSDEGLHEGPVKTVKQLVVAVIFAIVVPIAVIVLLVSYVSSGSRPAAGSDGLGAEAVARRIQPLARVVVRDASEVTVLKTGEQAYQLQCSACHAAGLVGAPKLGDVAAWAPRIATGYETLWNSALKGKNAMSAQSGGALSDFEIGRAVVYMANQGGAKFDEPKAPAGAASAAEPASAAAANAASAVVGAVAPTPPSAAPPPPPAAAATVAMATATTAVTGAGAVPALYTQACQACHVAGVAGAPKFGDKAAWAPRVGQGIDVLTSHVITGKGAMPPKGGSAASDAEIRAVVVYMVDAVK